MVLKPVSLRLFAGPGVNSLTVGLWGFPGSGPWGEAGMSGRHADGTGQ